MTTATDRTETSKDFESTQTLTAPPEKVLAALRTRWTNALDRLVSFVETGLIAYARDSFHSTMSVAARPRPCSPPFDTEA